jgi:hypothetical protein
MLIVLVGNKYIHGVMDMGMVFYRWQINEYGFGYGIQVAGMDIQNQTQRIIYLLPSLVGTLPRKRCKPRTRAHLGCVVVLGLMCAPVKKEQAIMMEKKHPKKRTTDAAVRKIRSQKLAL